MYEKNLNAGQGMDLDRSQLLGFRKISQSRTEYRSVACVLDALHNKAGVEGPVPQGPSLNKTQGHHGEQTCTSADKGC